MEGIRPYLVDAHELVRAPPPPAIDGASWDDCAGGPHYWLNSAASIAPGKRNFMRGVLTTTPTEKPLRSVGYLWSMTKWCTIGDPHDTIQRKLPRVGPSSSTFQAT